MNAEHAAKDSSTIESFRTQLERYQQLIDEDIATYAKQLRTTTLEQYGANARLTVDAYLDVLQRGGKRIRGALTMLGYEMSGGQDQAMILEAARAIEMLHAYVLIIDDIQDRSNMRRGGPAAHVLLADYHKQHELAFDAGHFGVALAINAGVIGSHAAQMVLANLKTSKTLRLKAIQIINETLMITLHGQTNDLINEVTADTTEADVERVAEWKTAHYTVLNPLHVGMVLAGADVQATEAITDYATQAGLAFQLTDDILGIFGTEFDSGKSPMDDLREGKRTMLIIYALEHAKNGNKNFLLQCLGKRNLSPAEFERCKDILVESGALAYTQQQAKRRVDAGLASLETEKARWSADGVAFLQGFAQTLLQRKA